MSKNETLTLNTELIRAPKESIDYVKLELALV